MKRKSGVVAAALLLGFGAATQALAQEDFDVTLEVLDDVSDVDGVALVLEDQDQRSEDGAFQSEGQTEDGAATDRQTEGFGEDGVAGPDGADGGDGHEDAIEDHALEQDRDESITHEGDLTDGNVDGAGGDQPTDTTDGV